jgi:hypothetical protein
MREGSAIDRIFSSEHTEEQIADVKEKMDAMFSDQDFKDLAEMEREKNPLERGLIDVCNSVLSEIRKKYDLPEFSVPEKNIHIIEEERWPSEGKNGAYKPSRQGIVLREQQNPLGLAHTMFHELAHFHSYQAFEVREKQPLTYRFGVELVTRDRDQQLFSPLNEAITENITRDFILHHRDHPLLKEASDFFLEQQQADPLAKNTRGESLFHDDAYATEEVLAPDNTPRLRVLEFSYPIARQALQQLCEKLSNANPDPITPSGIQEMFTRAMFTGNILSVGKMIDRRFGAGTYRRLGECQTEESLLEAVDQLT